MIKLIEYLPLVEDLILPSWIIQPNPFLDFSINLCMILVLFLIFIWVSFRNSLAIHNNLGLFWYYFVDLKPKPSHVL